MTPSALKISTSSLYCESAMSVLGVSLGREDARAGVGEGWNMGSSESVARVGGWNMGSSESGGRLEKRLEHGEF